MKEDWWVPWAFGAAVPAISWGIVFIARGVSAVSKKLAERRAAAEYKLRKCPHGEPSNGQYCILCVAERQRAGQTRAMHARAKELSRLELDRLSMAWRQKGESFLEMPWQQFEDEIAKCFEKQGYVVKQTNRSNDGGYDGIVTKGNRKYLFECKSGRQNIGRPDIQKFHSAMVSERADGGFFINTGTFSELAEAYARKMNVTIINRSELPRFVAAAYPLPLDSSTISLFCVICGETIKAAGLPAEAKCSVGHVIKNEITPEMIAKHGMSVRRERGRRRRYRR